MPCVTCRASGRVVRILQGFEDDATACTRSITVGGTSASVHLRCCAAVGLALKDHGGCACQVHAEYPTTSGVSDLKGLMHGFIGCFRYALDQRMTS